MVQGIDVLDLAVGLDDKITELGRKVIAGIKKGGGAIGKFYDPVFQWGDIIKDMKSNDPDVRNRAKADRDLDIFLKTVSIAAGAVNVGRGKAWDAIIGPLPIPMVTYYDFAESDSIVKYRSMGGEFFAHQGGDKTALRIDILLVGPEKELFMHMLRSLRLMCKSQTRGQTLTHQDESYLFDPINKPGEGLWRFKRVTRREAAMQPGIPGSVTPTNLPANIPFNTGVYKTIVDMLSIGWDPSNAVAAEQMAEQVNRLHGTNFSEGDIKALVAGRAYAKADSDADFIGTAPAGGVDPLSIQRVMATDEIMNGFTGEYFHHSKAYYDMQQLGYYTYHVNFPVIVDNMIFTDMWLETVQFTHDSKMGVDAVIGHLLLRKWIAPPRIRWSANGNNVSSLGGRREVDKKGKVKLTGADKWVWVWQDKVKPTVELYEFKIGMTVGIARALFLAPSAAYKYMNAGFLQSNHRTVSISAIFS